MTLFCFVILPLDKFGSSRTSTVQLCVSESRYEGDPGENYSRYTVALVKLQSSLVQ